MKQFIKEFLRRGLLAAWGGPVILAIIYGILGATGTVKSLAPGEVCFGIISVTLLAFIVAGMNAVFQVERMPLGIAIAIHGAGLYLTYILIYLLNGWLKQQLAAFGVFTGVFAAGYALIWLLIYLVTRAQARKINQKLQGS